ncbi:uncharacterized protein STEHIDRAFT_163721 [Stereum hirsutum FP-91666 SS1]|uniref:Uncharacterized protein n=1 Tax=Stereum hirsutum (strain FP-91666) TaxID=721885 RepID=R7RVW9_STEHR|nr:uncharacterized protein STEHIDRAFT_163721 [Stereum hirsutum FP-91666 SS1]EIM79364.1 hypothetical protein STEHIDRAFT_163721 [Stereum hirsutum FP-91666 SS1]
MVAGRPFQRALTFLFMTFLFLDALCVPMNVTIDDQAGDEVTGLKPIYSPAEEWQEFNCTEFNVADDPCSALDGTWHNATAGSLFEEPPSFTIQFHGTAIWISNIIKVGTFASLSFTLDDKDITLVAQGLDAIGTGDSDFQYNQTVFTKEGLKQGFHTVVGTVLFSDGPVLFDYAVYIFRTSTTQLHNRLLELFETVDHTARTAVSIHHTHVTLSPSDKSNHAKDLNSHKFNIISSSLLHFDHIGPTDFTIDCLLVDCAITYIIADIGFTFLRTISNNTLICFIARTTDMTEILDRGSGPSASPAVLSPPSLDLPSVLDIHAGTRTLTTGAAASPRSSISGIMSSLRREEALQDIADRLGLDMKSAGRRKVVVRRPSFTRFFRIGRLYLISTSVADVVILRRALYHPTALRSPSPIFANKPRRLPPFFRPTMPSESAWRKIIETNPKRVVEFYQVGPNRNRWGYTGLDITMSMLAMKEVAWEGGSSWKALVDYGIAEQLCLAAINLEMKFPENLDTTEQQRLAARETMESSYHIPVEILYMGAHHLESPLSSRDQKFILCIKRYWTALTDQMWRDPQRSLLPGPTHVFERAVFAWLLAELMRKEPSFLSIIDSCDDKTVPLISRFWMHTTHAHDAGGAADCFSLAFDPDPRKDNMVYNYRQSHPVPPHVIPAFLQGSNYVQPVAFSSH